MAAAPITDEMLSAWVDGELGDADRQRVHVWLQENPQEMARVQAWAADRAALVALYRDAFDEPVPQRLQAIVRGGHAVDARSSWPRAAAAAGLLIAGALLGGAGVWQWERQQYATQESILRSELAAGTAQGWVQRAAYAHSVYVGEPRHAVEVKANEEHLSRWLTRRIDMPVKLFDLQDQGFELVGGRLLPDGPGKSAQLLYQDAQQRRVTVYLRKPEKGTDVTFRYEQQGKVGMFYWVEEGAGYALVGELPKQTLLNLAQAIYNQHPAARPPVPASGNASVPTGSAK